jgi:hypothetical protein
VKTKTTDFQKLPTQNGSVSSSIPPISLTPVNTKKTALDSQPAASAKAAASTAQIRTDNNLALVPAPPLKSVPLTFSLTTSLNPVS